MQSTRLKYCSLGLIIYLLDLVMQEDLMMFQPDEQVGARVRKCEATIGGTRGSIGGYGATTACRCPHPTEGCSSTLMWFLILILLPRTYYRKKSIVVAGDTSYT